MIDMVTTLNISIACSIFMTEAQRQKIDAGINGEDTLSSANYK
ncbi:MAG: hypothetical protein ACJAUP_003399 [Cellvibrionaceae bacterium]|jgi:hypothetical protein